jgi:hypothetical protein
MSDQAIPERHMRVRRALHEGGPATPQALRERVARVEESAPRPARSLARPRFLAPAAGIAAAVVAALLVALSLGGGPSVVEAAEIAKLPNAQPAPAQDVRNPALLDRGLDGVPFPDWSKEFGWRAVGARSDGLDGRRTETVFYTHHGHRIGYTVISGEPLAAPDGAETLHRNGVEIRRFDDGIRTVVTFERDGQTCVLSGHVIDRDTLVKLAAWQGDGAVRF